MKFLIAILFVSALLSGCAATSETTQHARPMPELQSLLPPGKVLVWKRIQNTAPLYPREQVMKGVTGWVAIRYSVREDGTVESAAVVDSSPPGAFDATTLEFIKKQTFEYVGEESTPQAADDEMTIISYHLVKI